MSLFRILSIILLMAACAAVYLFYVELEHGDRARMERDASLGRIAVEEIDIEHLELTAGHSATSYALTGRVRNDAALALDALMVEVEIKDCRDTDCKVVGLEKVDLVPGEIPPGQTREVDRTIYLSGVTGVQGRIQWSWRVLSAAASP